MTVGWLFLSPEMELEIKSETSKSEILVSSYWNSRLSLAVEVFHRLARSLIRLRCSSQVRSISGGITMRTGIARDWGCHCYWYADATAGRSYLHIITLTDMIMNVVGLMQAKRLSEDGWLFELYSISNILSKVQRKRERERESSPCRLQPATPGWI